METVRCEHKSTYELPEPWPTGHSIEVCNCCGMSRAHHEQGETDWMQLNLYLGRKVVERAAQILEERRACCLHCAGDEEHY